MDKKANGREIRCGYQPRWKTGFVRPSGLLGKTKGWRSITVGQKRHHRLSRIGVWGARAAAPYGDQGSDVCGTLGRNKRRVNSYSRNGALPLHETGMGATLFCIFISCATNYKVLRPGSGRGLLQSSEICLKAGWSFDLSN